MEAESMPGNSRGKLNKFQKVSNKTKKLHIEVYTMAVRLRQNVSVIDTLRNHEENI